MNFEEIMKKLKAGTATPEERQFAAARMSEADAALSGKKQLDFDEALAHVSDGTATDEEREYVKQQLAEAAELMNAPSLDGQETLESEKREEAEAVAEARPVLRAEEDKSIEFEEALLHVQNGTATEQEKMYVISQTAAANALFSDESRMYSAPIKEASGDEVKKAKRSFKTRYVLIPLCVVLVAIVAVGAILGGVFGFAASSAKKNMKFNAEQCRTIAMEYVIAHQTEYNLAPNTFTAANLRFDETDRHFNYNDRNLGASYYSYEIEIKGKTFVPTSRKGAIELEVDMRINTATGNIEVIKWEFDD